MALTWPPGPLRVVGFGGMPVEAAAAMKPPIFEDANGRYFAGDPDSPSPPRFSCGREELEEYRRQGQVTLTSTTWQRIPGGVVLYAARSFFEAEKESFIAGSDPLQWDEEAQVYVGYLAREAALATLGKWGEKLLDDARHRLSGKPAAQDLMHALKSLQRARFTAPPPEHRELRIEMFVQLAAVFRALGHPVERVFEDASLDFDDLTVAKIKDRAEARWAGMTRVYPTDPPAAMGSHATSQPEQLSLLRDPADNGRIRLRVRRRAA